MKKGFLFLLIFLLVFVTNLFADDVYTLSSIIDLGIKNSIGLKIAELKLKNAQIDYKKAQANNLLTQSKTVELQAEISLLNAQNSYKNTRDQIISNIVKEAMSVVGDKINISINEKKVELYEKRLNDVKKEVDAGYKGPLDLLSSQNQYDNALFLLEKAKDKLKEDMRKLLIDLSLPLDKPIDIKVSEPSPITLDESLLLDTTLKNSLTLKIKSLDLELAKINLEKAQKVETPPLDLEKLQNSMDIATLSFEKERQSIISSFYTSYSLFTQAVSNLDIVRNNLEEKKKSYDIVKKQFEEGLKTEKDLLQAEIEVLTAEQSVKSAITSYWTSKIALSNVVGEDIENIGKNTEKEKGQK